MIFGSSYFCVFDAKYSNGFLIRDDRSRLPSQGKVLKLRFKLEGGRRRRHFNIAGASDG